MEFAEDVLGIELIPWQRWLLIHALELRPDGRFRFRTLLVLVARQNGKTTLVEVKNLWKMFVLQVPLVIGTAQNLDISEESWDKAVEIAESIPDLRVEIKHVDKTNGKKALKLANGSRWKIAAASRKGGRGLSGDDVNLDELREHQNWESWAAVTKTTMAKRNPQVWAYSNAGDDKSVVLNDLQGKARSTAEHLAALLDSVVAEAEAITKAAAEQGVDTTLGLFEWSAPEDVKCTCAKRGDDPHKASCRLWDRQAWAQANPSLGYTVTEEAIASALSTDPETIFRTEILCQHVPDLLGQWNVLTEADWIEAQDRQSAIAGPMVLSAAVALDRSSASIGVVGQRADGLRHVEVIEAGPGAGWVVTSLVRFAVKHKVAAIVIDEFGPTGSLIPELEKSPELERAGIKVERIGTADAARAFGMFYDGICGQPYVDKETGQTVNPRNLRHIGQDELTAAAAAAIKRSLGEGSAWDRKNAEVDITRLVSVTNANWGFAHFAHLKEQPFFGAWR